MEGRVLNADLGVDESGFEADEAGLTPLDGGELIDEGLFGVAADFKGLPELGNVLFEGGPVFDAKDYVYDGGEPVFEGVRAGFGFPLGGGRTF